jgi:hypothetical protein
MSNPATTNESASTLRFGIRTPRQLSEHCAAVTATEHMIEGILPKRSLSLVIGDSGLGKSPLMYQAATAVAAGLPFLGHTTHQGKVLYLDCENGIEQVDGIVGQVSKFLGVQPPEENLLLWNLNDGESAGLEELIKETSPNWIIIDPLKAFFQSIEGDNKDVTKAYADLRKLMQSYSCSISGVHHVKKPSQGNWDARPSLEGYDWREWFYQARGPRELINGCDVRLGVAQGTGGENKLVTRGFRRVIGEIPLTRLVRVLDDDGEPQGFRQIAGIELLGNHEQRAAYERLPERFRFKEAVTAYGRTDQPTADFLGNCITAGILRKLEGRSGYEKIRVAPELAAQDAGVTGAMMMEGQNPMTIQ